MLTAAAPSLSFSLVRDQRHTSATAAGDLTAWLSWLELGGASLETRQGYEWTLAKLLRSYPDHELADFTTDELMLWLRTYPSRSWRTRSAPARGWFKWAKKTRRIGDDPTENLPTIRRHKAPDIDVFDPAESDLLEGLPSPDGHLMAVLFDTGIRRGEALHMRAGDVQFQHGRIVVRPEGAKGGEGRKPLVGSALLARLDEWFTLDAIEPSAFLWAPRPGGHRYRRSVMMGDTSFMVWWQRCLAAAGVRYRKPHTTRHTYATRWLRGGGKRETLARQLGHKSTRTIDVYEWLDETDIRSDLELIQASRR